MVEAREQSIRELPCPRKGRKEKYSRIGPLVYRWITHTTVLDVEGVKHGIWEVKTGSSRWKF